MRCIIQLISLAICIVVVFGCGPRHIWKHPNKTNLESDKSACWEGLPDAVGADCIKHVGFVVHGRQCKPGVIPGQIVKTVTLSAEASERLESKCLKSKGWRKVEIP